MAFLNNKTRVALDTVSRGEADACTASELFAEIERREKIIDLLRPIHSVYCAVVRKYKPGGKCCDADEVNASIDSLLSGDANP